MVTVTMEDNIRERRKLIEANWRRVYGLDQSHSLVASEKEWEFFNALLDEIYGPHWLTVLKENHGKDIDEPNPFTTWAK